MKIFNTLTREKEEFVPVKEGEVKIYACGPTVYNYIHIGNARPICVFDVLRRYFEYRGYNVTFVQNFTDIDDKIIKKANEEGTDYQTVSEKYIEEFWKDAKGLNFRPATVHPKATENIDKIIEIVSGLIENGHAYAVDGDVYFSTKTFSEYGKLSHQPLEELEAGARIMVGDIKKDPMDFALWKAAKPGEPYWDSPWGKGRPGWHIECSAMSTKYLGKTIDIHGGAIDLIFPHHTNEIAQSECANGCDFVHTWMHNAYINVDNRKMSKSLGNFFTVRDVAKKYSYNTIRFFLLSSHYRSPMNFSDELMASSEAGLERIRNCVSKLEFLKTTAKEGEASAELSAKLQSYKDEFCRGMDDDLNTADAIAAIFEAVKYINTSADSLNAGDVTLALDTLCELCSVIGIVTSEEKGSLDDKVEALIEERAKARSEKNYKRADEIRDELKAMGIVLEDTQNGVKWKKI